MIISYFGFWKIGKLGNISRTRFALQQSFINKLIYYSTDMAELDVDAAPQWERSPYT
jgi:hypothetical protein